MHDLRPLHVQQSTQLLAVGGRQLAWVPKCAVLAGLVKRKQRVAKVEQRRATDCTGQVDWVQKELDEVRATAHD